jgi:hypothetical protein
MGRAVKVRKHLRSSPARGLAPASTHGGADAQSLASEALVPFIDGSSLAVNSPFWVAGQEKTKPRPAPAVGEHSDQVLREAGFADAEIQALGAEGNRLSFRQKSRPRFRDRLPGSGSVYWKLNRSVRSPIAGPFVGL